MESNPETTEISDTIVVGGDYSDASHDESDESIYGEGEEAQEQETVEPDAASHDYAKSFDSPSAHEDQSEAEDSQPDVSMASQSTNSPSAPGPLTSQPPAAAPSSSDHPPSLTPPPGLPQTNGPTQTPDASALSEQPKVSESPSEFSSTTPNASPSSAAPATAPAAASPERQANAPAEVAAVTAQAAPSTIPLSHPPSLPPKPSLPNPPASLPAIPQFQPRGPHPPTPGLPLNIAGPGEPHGTYVPNDGILSLPPIPSGAFGGPSHTHSPHLPLSGNTSFGNYHALSIKQRWEQFQADEKRYTSEAKWERFPEGSRIFIGNLSSERVSKREVFDVFNRFGRLAQISLKNAYGFVQYHTVAEGHAAMQGAQGIELGGRRIHLEISRTQKKKDDRERSPDRRNLRDARPNGRYDGGDHGWRRDDYRPGRSPSPRRSEHRYSRDREFGPHARRRSRSPPRYGRYGDDSYRRRSPSPHRRAPSDGERFDLPRRYGSDVPDVQILLLQEVSRDFIGWVQGAFHSKGLKTDVMYINPRFPRDTVVQRQVVEGVHAIVDLDYAAQAQGKIPIQVFIRSGGSSVRFELYQGIDPPVAAELVVREKSQSAAYAAPSRPAYLPNTYPPYQTEPAPAGYVHQYPPHSGPSAHPQAAPATAPPAANLANAVSQLDNSALQALLASLQTPQPGAPHAHPGIPPANAAPAPQIDVNALLGSLRSATPAQPAPVPGVPSYGAAPPPAYVPPVGGAMPSAAGVPNGYGGVDTAQQVQTIIDQLKRAAQ
ncbi:hypothetical protein C8A03DRAFT_28920 [Achaetomium macrosporum]|uniref:RRM domain-containing protein n=1 Tax=Achaetomium macrosporum TaxID=79813 RepID=A0AAN7CIX1_9PEZI|nr:hypothetical protein C8A03DRAFT_28920 [Achaetomium macrosporum]